MELVGDIAQVVSAAVIIIALIYGFAQYREVKRTREATYLVPLLEEWKSPEIQGVIKDIQIKEEQGKWHYCFVRANRLDVTRFCRVPVFFNSLAKLVDLKAITEKTALEQFELDAIFSWELYSDFISDMREDYTNIYGGFERFAAKSREWRGGYD